MATWFARAYAALPDMDKNRGIAGSCTKKEMPFLDETDLAWHHEPRRRAPSDTVPKPTPANSWMDGTPADHKAQDGFHMGYTVALSENVCALPVPLSCSASSSLPPAPLPLPRAQSSATRRLQHQQPALPSVSRPLVCSSTSEALPVHDGGPRLVVVVLGDPGRLEGAKGGEDRAANPDRVLPLRGSNYPDLPG